MDEQQYRAALKAHDWYYGYAKSKEYWKGNSERHALREARREIDPDYTIWNQYAPEQFQVNVA